MGMLRPAAGYLVGISTIVCGTIFLIGALALADSYVFIAINPEKALLRYPFWLSSLAYGGALLLCIAGLRLHRLPLLGASLVCGLAFLLSLRSIELNAGLVEVNEYYAGNIVRTLGLERFNDDPYCIIISPLRFDISHGKGHAEFAAYRGVWPVYFSDAAIAEAMLPLHKCPA